MFQRANKEYNSGKPAKVIHEFCIPVFTGAILFYETIFYIRIFIPEPPTNFTET